MSHPLDGASAKIDRAAEHLNTLSVEASRFLDPPPWDLYGEILHDPDRLAVTVGQKKEPPLRLGAIFGDVMQNLRSSLDYVVNELVVLNGEEPTDRTAFPIIPETPKKIFKNATEQQLEGVADDPKKLIEELQPYNRTDAERDALIIVQEFSNRDKHRTITPLIAAPEHPGENPDVMFTTNKDARLQGRVLHLPWRPDGGRKGDRHGADRDHRSGPARRDARESERHGRVR
jgi:hypothetical protein